MPTRSRSTSSRHYTGYGLIVLLMVGTILAYQVWRHSEDLHDYHQQLALTSVNGAADELELLLTELQRSMRLFADERHALFEDISKNPDNEANWLLLENSVRRHFPEYFGMTMTNASGQALRPDFDNLVDEMCQQDIEAFIEDNYQLHGYVHPNPISYHFDVMVPWGDKTSPQGVFFLSFSPAMLVRTLQRIQPPGHQLLVLRHDKNGLIEATSAGTRQQLQREFFLSSEEQSCILVTRSIDNSRWDLVDLPEPGLFRNEVLRNVGHASVIFLVFLLVVSIMLYLLRRKEQRRQQAEALALRHQSELAHVDRINIMGEMASSLAHELNQPLAAISTYCQAGLRLIEKDSDKSGKLKHALEHASQQSQRAGHIIRRIRRLAGKGVARREPVYLNPVIQDAIDFLAVRLKRHNIILNTELTEGLPAAMADEIQIEQVVLNLLNNAIEAMSTARGQQRLLTISSRQSAPDTLLVTITDTGTGMDDATLSNIFDTFYTTRETGMGVGLSISRSIIEAHGGRLWAQSVPGKGASFFFTLNTEDIN